MLIMLNTTAEIKSKEWAIINSGMNNGNPIEDDNVMNANISSSFEKPMEFK